jgi:hypothetical protein
MRASVAGGIFPESKLAPLPHGATGSAFSSMSTSWSAFQVEGLVLRSGLTCFRFRMLFSVSVSYRKHVNHTSRSSLPTIFPESKLAPLSHGATGSAFSSTSISYSAFRVWVITCLQLRMLFEVPYAIFGIGFGFRYVVFGIVFSIESKLAPLPQGATGSAIPSRSVSYSAFRV